MTNLGWFSINGGQDVVVLPVSHLLPSAHPSQLMALVVTDNGQEYAEYLGPYTPPTLAEILETVDYIGF